MRLRDRARPAGLCPAGAARRGSEPIAVPARDARRNHDRATGLGRSRRVSPAARTRFAGLLPVAFFIVIVQAAIYIRGRERPIARSARSRQASNASRAL